MNETKGYILVSDDKEEPNWDGLLFSTDPAMVYLNIHALLVQIDFLYQQHVPGRMNQQLTIIPLNNKQIASKLNAGEITF